MDADKTAMIGGPGAGATSGDEACPNCTTQILVGDEFCLKCGYQRGTWQGSAAPSANGAGSAAATPSAAPAAPTGPALWTLDLAGAEHPLAAGTYELGRGEVDFRVDDSYASRRHAQLEVSAERIVLSDLGSSNGTFLADERLPANDPRALTDGGSFKVANTELTVRRAEQSAPAAAGGDATQVAAAELSASDTSAGSTPMEASMQPQRFDDEGTAVDPASEVEPGKEGSSPVPHVDSHWKLEREGGDSIELPPGETTIGRKTERAGQVVEGDSYISGLHCRIIASDDRLEITDLGSTNGTFVNEARLEAEQPWPLAAGDKLRLGQTNFHVADTRAVTEGQEQTEAEETE